MIQIQPKHQQALILLLILTAMGIGFFMPVRGTGAGGYLLKGLIFILVVFAGYLVLQSPVFGFSEAAEDDPDTDETGPAETEVSDALWKGFGPSFRLTSMEMVSVCRQAVVALCGGLYLKTGQGLVFQGGETEEERILDRMPVPEDSLVGQIARSGEPLLEGNLPLGTVLEGLTEPEIRSFLGVPLLWGEDLIGVLAMGSDTTDSFSEEDQDLAARCGTVITEVLAVSHKGMQWEANQEIYKTYLELEKALYAVDDEDSAVFHFVQVVQHLYPFERFTLCEKEGEFGVISHVFGQVDNLDRGLRFPLDEGLNGWVLRRRTPILIADMEEGDYRRPRYFRNEDRKHHLRSFIGIPLGRGEEAWGCISFESRRVGQYGEKGKEVLLLLSLQLQNVLERIRLKSQLDSKRNDKLIQS